MVNIIQLFGINVFDYSTALSIEDENIVDEIIEIEIGSDLLIWWSIAIFVVIVLAAAKKYPKIRKIVLPIQRWTDYWLNFVMGTTIILAICIILTVILGFILYWSETVPNIGKVFWDQVRTGTIWETILRAFRSGRLGDGILYGIRLVFDLLEGEYEELRAGYPSHPDLTWWLCFLVPVMTVITVIVALFKVFPKFFFPRKEFLIFAQAEENSILLAESMMYREKNRKVRKDRKVIFLRAKGDNLTPEFSERIKKIKARVYPYTEADLMRIHKGLRKKKLRFFFLSSNTELNFSRMKLFLEEVEEDKLFLKPIYENRKKQEEDERIGIFRQELYLLSETESAPLLIDHLRMNLCKILENGELKRKSVFLHTDLRLLDRYRTVMNDLLQRKPLYECADEKKIRVLILGFGRVGKAFFRSAVSSCAMAGFETSFCIIDSIIKKQWHDLILQYPECAKGLSVFKGSLNVESEELLAFLDEQSNGGKPYTYIVLSLGDDERNIKVASRISRYYRKRYWENKNALQPVICVNLEDEIKSDYVSAFFKNLLPQNPPFVFGSDHHTFSENMLVNRDLWAVARKLHVSLKSNNLIYWNEYERRSSVACVAHASYHCKAAESFSTEGTHELYFDNLSEEQKELMVDAEHRRWVSYSRSEGMQYISPDIAKVILSDIGTHVDINAQLTPCVIPTKELDNLYRTLYPNVKEENRQRAHEKKPPYRSFYERDRFVVRNIYRIQDCLGERSADTKIKEFEAAAEKHKH